MTGDGGGGGIESPWACSAAAASLPKPIFPIALVNLLTESPGDDAGDTGASGEGITPSCSRSSSLLFRLNNLEFGNTTCLDNLGVVAGLNANGDSTTGSCAGAAGAGPGAHLLGAG